METRSFQEILHFSRKERIGIIVIVLVLLLLYFLPEIFMNREPVHTHKDVGPSLTVTTLPDMDEDPGGANSKNWHAVSEKDAGKSPGLFEFDPNTLGEEGFIRLGLRSNTIKIILNYRKKGGRFFTADDLRRVYGLKESEFARLQGYIHIADTSRRQSFLRRDSVLTKKTAPAVIIDINRADSAMWDALPGIGSVLSARIVRYREKLGGFVEASQLREVYGISDSVFTLILPRLYSGGEPLRRISVNTEEEFVLSAHPYIGRALAREMVAYRSAHGPFRDTAAFYLLMSRSATQIKRIFPYLKME